MIWKPLLKLHAQVEIGSPLCSIDLVKEVHEFLKIYFVVRFSSGNLYHSYAHKIGMQLEYWRFQNKSWKPFREGLRRLLRPIFARTLPGYSLGERRNWSWNLLWISSSETVSPSSEKTHFKSYALMYPFLDTDEKWLSYSFDSALIILAVHVSKRVPRVAFLSQICWLCRCNLLFSVKHGECEHKVVLGWFRVRTRVFNHLDKLFKLQALISVREAGYLPRSGRHCHLLLSWLLWASCRRWHRIQRRGGSTWPII